MTDLRLLSCACLLAVAAHAADAPAAPAAPATRAPAVWFNGHYYHTGVSYLLAQRLAKEGFAVNTVGHSTCIANQALTWDQMRRYNVIVLKGMDPSAPDGGLSASNTANLALLRRFLDEGGGLLVTPTFTQQNTMLPTQQALLGDLGMQVHFDELLCDPSGRAIATTWKLPFLRADILPVPGLPPLSGMWVPEAIIAGAQTHSVALTTDASWTPLLRAGSGASTRKWQRAKPFVEGEIDAAPVGTYASAPLLAAVRQVGKGRIAVIGITPEYLLDEPAKRALDGVVYDTGTAGRRSDGAELVVATLRWLAEPSAASTALGGAKMDPESTVDPTRTRFVEPWNWTTRNQPPADPRQQAGVFGARSAVSTGTGSVREWVAAARAADLSYLVFLEEFAALTPEKFKAFKAECQAASTDGFTAIPGFTIDDIIGNHYFWCSVDLPWPEAKLLDAEGKRFASPGKAGAITNATLAYFHSQAGMKLFGGNYLYTQDAAPYVDWFSDWCGSAVITSRDGRQVEDISPDYLKLAKSGQLPVPVAIDLISDPKRLAASPWRTMATLPAPDAQGKGLDVATLFSRWQGYPYNPTAVYITSGPRIDNWSMIGPRDYEGANQGDFVWQNLRWQVHAKVSSEIGLAEVALYDGPELLRRFQPKGEKAFTVTLDLAHDRQHNLVLMVTDLTGGRAVSGEQIDRNHRLEEFMCGDRHNHLTYGYTTASDGVGLLAGGCMGLSTPNKRVAPINIAPSGTFKDDKTIGSSAFDGQTHGEPLVSAPVRLRSTDPADRVGGKTSEFTELAAPTACESLRVLHTGDVNIGESRWTHRFTDDIPVTNVWGTMWSVEPAKDYTVTLRPHFFQLDPDSPLAVFLWSYDITLLRDLPNRGITLAQMTTRDARLWTLADAVSTLAGVWEDTRITAGRPLSRAFAPGDYAASLDSPLGGCVLYPLSPGMTISTHLPSGKRMHVGLDAATTPQRKGQTAHADLLMLGIPRNTPRTGHLPCNTTEVAERFRADFGLGGRPANYRVEATQGTVARTSFPLRVDGATQGGFSAKLTGKLVSSLPIVVGGLNQRWSAVLFDRSLKQARPVGLLDGAAWATVNMRGTTDVFIGHPVTCDQPGLVIQVVQTGAKAWSVEVHNPTAQPVTTVLKANPACDPFVGKALPEGAQTIAAGTSLRFTL